MEEKVKKLESIQKYIDYIIGMVLLGVSFNEIFLPNNYFGYGTMNVGILSNNIINPVIVILFFNLICFFLSYVLLDAKRTKEAFVSTFMFPLVLYVTSLIPDLFNGIDKYLLVILASVMTGYGYGLIHKYDMIVDGFDIIEIAMRKISPKYYKLIIRCVNASFLIISFFLFGLEKCLFSTIIYFIIIYFSHRIHLGVSDAKTFCIITDKYKDIQDSIIEKIGSSVNIVDIEGGYSKKKQKMLVSVIDTREYYLLKEMVKSIDPNAFVTILDSYQVYNVKKY